MRRVLSNITKVPLVSAFANEGKLARGNRVEPSLTRSRLVNRVMSRFRCWFPFTVATNLCAVYVRNIDTVRVYRGRKLQRTFAPCTGARAPIDVVAKAKTAAVRT